ncbi:MAG: hypothetical protein KDK99_21340, partial [Verrucomicrobiales bacterium]|nr:hypothetical protein [Verrucomicrobiales bacterium]
MERRASSATPWQRDRSLCNRLVGITACLVIGFTIVSWRLYQLQLRQHEELSAAAYEKFHRDEPLPALRGAIRDRMGEYLAHDERCWELYVDRDHLKDNTRVCANYALMQKVPEAELKAKFTPAELFAAYTAESARRLAPEIGLAEEEVLAALRSKRHVEILRRELDEKTKDYLDHFLQSEHLFGIYTRGDVRRLYPAANRLALLLGRMVPGKGAISGLEKLCDEVLTGIPGERSIERDRVGFELPQYRGEVTPPQDGADVFTSIDMNLQEITEVILERAFLEYSP